MNILYAEDDKNCRDLFALVLRQQGHVIHEAINGAQAVQIVRDEPIDLAILDSRMPMMSGYAAARIISQEAPRLPIAFLSARGMPQDKLKAYNISHTVIDYRVKPTPPSQFINWVESTFKLCHTQGLSMIREENMAREWVAE